MPLTNAEVPGNMWGHGERLFCLLEDDSLITKACINTDQLLRPLAQGQNATDIDVLMKVSINVLVATPMNYLLGEQ